MPNSTPTSKEVFQRFAAGTRTAPVTPTPPFPPIPDAIKEKFPDLQPHWDAYEKAVALWVKQTQTV